MKLKNVGAFIFFTSVTAAASLIGSSVMRRQRTAKAWYRGLRKPPQTPPDWVFGVVWPMLYSAIAYSGYRGWKNSERAGNDRRKIVGLWGAQLAFNAAWTPLFFGQHRSRAALADLALNMATLAAYTKNVARVDKPAAWLMAPYLGWLAFASTINMGVVRRNPKWLAG